MNAKTKNKKKIYYKTPKNKKKVNFGVEEEFLMKLGGYPATLVLHRVTR